MVSNLEENVINTDKLSDGAIFKVLGTLPTSFMINKLNARFIGRTYDTAPNALTAKILAILWRMRYSGTKAQHKNE